jgi:hypothetical protein
MLNKLILIFAVITIAGITACFAEEVIPAQGMPGRDLEWSDYGLNFEWAKDKKLVKELALSDQQKEELAKLTDTAGQNTKTDEDIMDKATQLKRQIELKSLIKINGQFTQPDQAVIDPLIEQISKLKSEKYSRQMSVKAKLKMLLADKQRDVLYAYFQAKEKELRDKFREQMQGPPSERGESGGHRGMEGMGGMGGMGHGGFGGGGY